MKQFVRALTDIDIDDDNNNECGECRFHIDDHNVNRCILFDMDLQKVDEYLSNVYRCTRCKKTPVVD